MSFRVKVRVKRFKDPLKEAYRQLGIMVAQPRHPFKLEGQYDRANTKVLNPWPNSWPIHRYGT